MEGAFIEQSQVFDSHMQMLHERRSEHLSAALEGFDITLVSISFAVDQSPAGS
jgi:hypothetical protein